MTFEKFLFEDELLSLRDHLPTYFTYISLADRAADTEGSWTRRSVSSRHGSTTCLRTFPLEHMEMVVAAGPHGAGC